MRERQRPHPRPGQAQDLSRRPVRRRLIVRQHGALSPKVLGLRLPVVVVVRGQSLQRRRQRVRIVRLDGVENGPLARRERPVVACDPVPDEGVRHLRADHDVAARGDVDHGRGPGRVVRLLRAVAGGMAAPAVGPGENAHVPRLDRAAMRDDEAPGRVRVVRQPAPDADEERRFDLRFPSRRHRDGAQSQVKSVQARGAGTLRRDRTARHADDDRRFVRGVEQEGGHAVGAVARRRDLSFPFHRHRDGARSEVNPVETQGGLTLRRDRAARHADDDRRFVRGVAQGGEHAVGVPALRRDGAARHGDVPSAHAPMIDVHAVGVGYPLHRDGAARHADAGVGGVRSRVAIEADPGPVPPRLLDGAAREGDRGVARASLLVDVDAAAAAARRLDRAAAHADGGGARPVVQDIDPVGFSARRRDRSARHPDVDGSRRGTRVRITDAVGVTARRRDGGVVLHDDPGVAAARVPGVGAYVSFPGGPRADDEPPAQADVDVVLVAGAVEAGVNGGPEGEVRRRHGEGDALRVDPDAARARVVFR